MCHGTCLAWDESFEWQVPQWSCLESPCTCLFINLVIVVIFFPFKEPNLLQAVKSDIVVCELHAKAA